MIFLKKHKITIICLISLIVMIFGVKLWNYISDLQAQDKMESSQNKTIDVSDANNVPSVEAKFGEDIKITQGYLLSYTRRKSAIWYMSSAYVKSIKKQDSYTTITLKNKNNSLTLKASIESSKADVKKNDLVNFVGTINLETGSLELSKISKEKIDYRSVTEIEFDDLVNNIKTVKSNYFIISGYMVTDNNQYKLYDTKDKYKKDKSAGSYFIINWKDEFNYTGNTKVTIKCLIDDTYKLGSCEMIK